MKYLVIEVQKFDSGAITSPVTAHDTLNGANAKYHQVLASAAVSSLPVHSAAIITEEGAFVKGECFTHEAEAQE